MGESLVKSVLSKPSELNGREVTLFTLASLVFYYLINFIKARLNYNIDAPVAAYKSSWEPEWLLRLRFPFTSKEILYSGYDKFKDRIFKIIRNDTDIFILPHRYLKQLGNLTEDHSSSSKGQIRNMADKWSTCDIILGSDVHFRMIQQVLTKNITATIPMMKEVLDLAIEKEISDCKGKWVELSIFDLLSRITARVTMRVFVGLEACRNEDWLKASLDYDINVGTTVILLRMFPPFLYLVIARMLPSWYRAHGNIRTAESIIGPIIRKRAEARARGGLNYARTDSKASLRGGKGYIWANPSSDTFVVEKGDGVLKDYQFGNKSIAHKFCPTCGTAVMGQRLIGDSGIAVNVRTFKDFDETKLEIKSYDGAKTGPRYTPPNGAEIIDLDGSTKRYQGSCHCGKVTFDLKSQPLEEVEITSCNCSICSRHADLWIYPPKESVSLHAGAHDHLTVYQFARRNARHSFCSTCGVPIVNQIVRPSGTTASPSMAGKLPVNVRAVNGVDFDKLKLKRVDGKNMKGPKYEV